MELDLERERKIATLCREALDVPASEVTSWLRDQCGGDEALFEEVQEYLAEIGRSQSDFTNAVFSGARVSADWSESAMRDQVIGPYRILAKLGEGGMGSVFLAEQTRPLTRKVALKIVKRIRDPNRKKKISAEVQAMALLSHPYITQVYEVGTTESGHLYFAMEYVPGDPLTQFCDQHQMPLEDRLWLLVNVCKGVAHAHDEKILHRDLKPSNILVVEIDGRPVPKIIDFGTVSVQARPEFDDLSMLDGAGTPVYMSPEALHVFGPLELDARTDVYALGMILFELVTGLRPYAQDELGVSRIIEKVANDELPKPSERFAASDAATQQGLAAKRGLSAEALQSRLSGELDRIATKAIARNREARYRSAQDLGRDLESYLRGRLQTGQKPVPRGAGFTSRWRNPLVWFLVAMVLAMAVVLLERGRKMKDAAQAWEAETRFSEILSAKVINRAHGRLSRARQLETLDEEVRRFAADLENQPLLQAKMFDVLGRQYLRLGELETGGALLEKALALCEAHLPEEHRVTTECLVSMAELRARQGALDEALAILNKANARIATKPALLVRVSQTLSLVYGRLGRFEDRDVHLTQNLEAAKKAPNLARFSVIELQKIIADHENELGRFSKAERHLQEAMALVPPGDETTLASLLWRLGIAWRGLGEDEAARMVTAPAAGMGIWEDRWLVLLLLAESSLDRNEPLDAEAYLSACVELEETLLPGNGDRKPMVRMAMARMYRQLGRFGSAADELQKAMDEGGPYFERSLIYAKVLLESARVWLAMGCEDEAVATFKQAMALFESQAPEHPARVTCLAELASLSLEWNDLDNAKHHLQRAKLLRARYCAPQSKPYRRVTEVITKMKERE